MYEKNLFDGVEDTLYIPLAARIFVSEKFPNFFYDEKALSLKEHMPLGSITKNSSEYFYMASVCRQKTIDDKIKRFLNSNSVCNVVFLGAGLETAYHRLGCNNANFYQVDLPDVIEIRERLLGKRENETLIEGDMFELRWIEEIDTTLPTLISVSGVYQYFDEPKIVEMIRRMKELFPYGELVFDATNKAGLKFANKYVKKTGNENAQMYFSVDNPQEFAKMTGTELVEVDGFYKDALKECGDLKVITKIFMYLSDKWKRTMVIHLILN